MERRKPFSNTRVPNASTKKEVYAGLKTPSLTKSSLEPLRNKMGKYLFSIPSKDKLDHKFVIKVKGKLLNSFLGIIKTEVPNLRVEAFPQELNKQLNCLLLLHNYDLVWFDF